MLPLLAYLVKKINECYIAIITIPLYYYALTRKQMSERW